MTNIKPLDPQPGDPIPFRRVGRRWLVGNRPARVAAEIVEENGQIRVLELGAQGAVVDVTVVREKAA